jgi:predicted lipoprotein with Yx(FWY)xxD motif
MPTMPHVPRRAHSAGPLPLLIAGTLALPGCGTDVAAPGAGNEDAAASSASASNAGGSAVPGDAVPTDLPPSSTPQGSQPVVRLGVQSAPQPHLVDASGASLYYLEDNADGRRCDAACQAIWPPVLGQGEADAAMPGVPPVDSTAIGSTQVQQGPSTQVTYRGQPLYRYAGDLGSRRTAGDGIKDEWGQWRLATL